MTQSRAPTPLHSQGQKVDLCVPVCVGVQACACPRCSVVVCVCVGGCLHTHVFLRASVPWAFFQGDPYVAGGTAQMCISRYVMSSGLMGAQGASRLGKRCSSTRLSPPRTAIQAQGCREEVQVGQVGQAEVSCTIQDRSQRRGGSGHRVCVWGPLSPAPGTLCTVSTAGLKWMGWDDAWTQPHTFHAPPPGPTPHPAPVLRASLLPDSGAGGAPSSVLSRHHSLAPLHPRRLAQPSPRGHSCHADLCY